MNKGMKRFPGRPYPKDHERRRLVMLELADRYMTITQLAQAVGIALPHVSSAISGRRRSPMTEDRIAAFFGKAREELFPLRSKKELEAMRKTEQQNHKGGAA